VKPINEKDEDAQLQDEGRDFSIIVSNKRAQNFLYKILHPSGRGKHHNKREV
jgi:hypothetical protein